MFQSLLHSSINSESARGMTVVKMRTVMLNVQLSTRLCPTQYLNARDSGSQASKQNSLAGKPAKRRNSKELAKEHRALQGTAVRCKVCPKPAPNANFCCVQCSNEMDGCIFGVCGSKSGRICSQIHQKRM